MSTTRKVTLRKNSGADLGSQERINFIQGANITLTLAEDAANKEFTVTIAAPGLPPAWLDQFFPTVNPDSNKGTYTSAVMTDTIDVTVRQTFIIPGNIATIDYAYIIVIPNGTGNIRWTCATSFATCGEDFEIHTDSIGASLTALTTDEIECIDVSAAFTGALGLDVVGLEFTRTGSDVSDTIDADVHYLGILIRGSE